MNGTARLFVFLASLLAQGVLAQQPAPAPSPLPVIEPANEIKGPALLEALRKGGLVLYMRHAQHARYSKECIASDLSDAGEAQVRKVGAALHELRIPVGKVLSSPMCRSIDTSKRLDFGAAEVTEDVMPGVPALRKRLSQPPASGTNTILVSHIQPSANKVEAIHLEFAEIIAFRPDGRGASEPVARIRVEDWDALRALK